MGSYGRDMLFGCHGIMGASRCHAPVQKKKKHFIRMNELTGDDSEIAKWKYEMVQTSCMFYLFKQQRWELQIYFGSVWMG